MESSKTRWVFYLRVACKHFVPCDKCQKIIEKQVETDLTEMNFQTGYQIAENVVFRKLCEKCKKGIVKKIMNSERIILGNKDYEPIFELQREIPKKQQWSRT